MPINLTFTKQYDYSTLLSGITVPVKISSGDETVAFDAKINTGSTHCIFQRKHIERLGLEIETGERHEFSTAIGTFSAFGHDVEISCWELLLLQKYILLRTKTFRAMFWAERAGLTV